MATKNNPGKFDCYENAHPDEPMFVLLGRDPCAAAVVEFWKRLRVALGQSAAEAQIEEATICAGTMREWARGAGKAALVSLADETARDVFLRGVKGPF